MDNKRYFFCGPREGVFVPIVHVFPRKPGDNFSRNPVVRTIPIKVESRTVPGPQRNSSREKFDHYSSSSLSPARSSSSAIDSTFGGSEINPMYRNNQKYYGENHRAQSSDYRSRNNLETRDKITAKNANTNAPKSNFEGKLKLLYLNQPLHKEIILILKYSACNYF